jgi:hypothetical protein
MVVKVAICQAVLWQLHVFVLVLAQTRLLHFFAALERLRVRDNSLQPNGRLAETRKSISALSLSAFQTLSKRSNQREWRGDVLSIFLSSAPQVIKKKGLSTKLPWERRKIMPSLSLRLLYFVLSQNILDDLIYLYIYI